MTRTVISAIIAAVVWVKIPGNFCSSEKLLVGQPLHSHEAVAKIPINSLCRSTTEQSLQSDGEWIPNERVRNHVSSLSSGDITYIEFSGDTMTDVEGADCLRITDPKIIGMFVDALHHAMYWRKNHPSEIDGLVDVGPHEADGVIKLFLKGHKYLHDLPDQHQWGEQPIKFPFIPLKDTHLYYGPDFYDALLALQKYQRNQIHEEVKRLAPQVVAIQFSLDPVVVATDFPPDIIKTAEVEEVLRALRQSDERIYDCTFEGVANPTCQLQLRDGSKVNLCIIIPGLYKGDYYDPPWLMRLWKYLKRPTPGGPRRAASD